VQWGFSIVLSEESRNVKSYLSIRSEYLCIAELLEKSAPQSGFILICKVDVFDSGERRGEHMAQLFCRNPRIFYVHYKGQIIDEVMQGNEEISDSLAEFGCKNRSLC
jgi:hypothetical protein